MSSQQGSAVVVPLRVGREAAAIAPEQQPKVLSPSFVERLRALNDASRWLRISGHPPEQEYVQGDLPEIRVDAQAARLLVSEAHGYSSRRVDEHHRMCSVVVKGCLITWSEAT